MGFCIFRKESELARIPPGKCKKRFALAKRGFLFAGAGLLWSIRLRRMNPGGNQIFQMNQFLRLHSLLLFIFPGQRASWRLTAKGPPDLLLTFGPICRSGTSLAHPPQADEPSLTTEALSKMGRDHLVRDPTYLKWLGFLYNLSCPHSRHLGFLNSNFPFLLHYSNSPKPLLLIPLLSIIYF